MKRTIIITGAAGNMGLAVVKKFASGNYNVLAVVSPGKAADSPSMSGEVVVEADLTDETQAESIVETCIEKFGRIDAAILLVGGFAAGGLAKANGKAIKKMIALNFETAYYVARPVFERMKNSGTGGRIVLVGARPALSAKDGKALIAYALSKSMLFKLAELLNEEGAPHQIVTSVIVPSTIDTPQNREAMPDSDFSKWVSTEEIASAISFLCSAENGALREPVIKMYGRS
jgi:NAD(P)-dependent dehydrogenase (short-subunit alcohol dehydrogenase family)